MTAAKETVINFSTFMKEFMRNLFLMIIASICVVNSSLAGITVEKNVLNSVSYAASSTYQNKICLLGYNNTDTWIEYFNGKQWNVIPLLIKNQNGNNDTIKIESHTGKCLAFDLQGNIWLCAKLGLYKYNGTDWLKYSIDDEYADRREFKNVVFAPNGTAYVTAEYPKVLFYDEKTKIIDKYTSVLMKFDGSTFSTIDTTEGGLSGLGSDGGILLLKNGKLLVHVYRPGVPQLYENNLYVYDTDNGNSKTIQTLYNPHALDKADKFKFSVFVNDIFEDKTGNVWFALYGGLQDDFGAVVWKNDNSWEVVKVPLRYNYARQFIPGDSSYYPVFAFREDKNGQIWIGGAIVLNKIRPDLTLGQFDDANFFNNLTVFTTYSSSGSYFDVDSIVKYLNDLTCNCLVNKYSPLHPAFVSHIETTEEGIWFLVDGLGAVRYKPTQTVVEDGERESDEPFVEHSSSDFSKAGVITITVNKPYPVESITLYDIGGQRVYSENFNSSKLHYEVRPPLNSIATGVYIISVNGKDRSFFKKIFIY